MLVKTVDNTIDEVFTYRQEELDGNYSAAKEQNQLRVLQEFVDKL